MRLSSASLPASARRRRANRPQVLYAALLAAAVTGGCGGGGNSADPATASSTVDLTGNPGSTTSAPAAVAPATLAVSGRVMNVGYLGNTKVCIDLNDNNLCDSGEPTTTTDAQGRYALTVNPGSRGVHLLAEVRPTSVDTGYAKTAAGANPIQQGWLLSTPLEYTPGATAATANLTLISSTYHMRLMSQGHYRLTNRLATLTRAGKTDDYSVGADFDYVAAPPAGLAASLARLTDYLSTRAAAAKAPASLIDTASVLSAWYGTYNATTTPIMDVAKFTSTTPATIASNLDTFAYRYYHTKADIAAEMRDYMVDNDGLVRSANTIQTLTSQGFALANGAYRRVFQQYSGGAWTDVSFAESAYLTLDAGGAVKTVQGTDYLQPRAITALDGNQMVYQMPVNGVRYALDLDNDRLANYYLYDWGKNTQQLTTALYNYTRAPSARPACAADYNTGAASTSTSPASWYSSCVTYYLYQYIGGLNGYKTTQDATAQSEFYDETLLDPLVRLPLVHPLIADCGAAGRASVVVAGNSTCNTMTGDAASTHVRSELFAASGIRIESWTQTNPLAASAAAAPRQLTLVLRSDGTGTLTGTAASSVAAYTTNGSTPIAVTAGTTVVSEEVKWSAHPQNGNVVLVDWKTPSATDSARALPAHFANADFSMVPSTPANPRFNKIAIALQDGVFVSGMYYGPGFFNNFTGDVYKRFNRRALELGTGMLGYIVGKLYAEAGFQ